MKLSELDEYVAMRYLRIDAEDLEAEEIADIANLVESATSYVLSYTGLSADDADEIDELTNAALIFIQNLYDNRSMYISNGTSQINKAIDSILGLHSFNLL